MAPTVTKMEVYPVAGKDCMELNLSGAHAPFFTRNIVVLYADNGEMGVGEVPGSKKITQALKECIPLVEGTRVSEYKSTLLKVKNIWILKVKLMREGIRPLICVPVSMCLLR